jgi:hypothetical protein
MPLEVVRGESRNRLAAEALADQLRSVVSDGTVYLAYPVLATADERVEVDALQVSRDHGLVAFLLPDTVPVGAGEWDRLVSDQDRLYAVLEGHLRRHEALRSGRRLALTPNTATIFPGPVSGLPEAQDGFYGSFQDIPAFLGGLSRSRPRSSVPSRRPCNACQLSSRRRSAQASRRGPAVRSSRISSAISPT